MTRTTRAEQLATSIDRLLARVSPSNRPYALRSLQLRRNRGNKDSSNYAFLQIVVQLDEACRKRPFRVLGPDDLSDVVALWRSTKKPKTVAQNALFLRAIFKDVLNVEKLPRDYKRVLEIKEPAREVRGLVISDAQLHDLLSAVVDLDATKKDQTRVLMKTALAWVLRDVGFRARECLSLNVSDARFADGGVYLRLRPDAPDLKTGPREVFGQRCAAPIRAWLDLHPAGHDASAPLWIGERDQTGYNRLAYKQLYKLLCRAGDAAGIAPCPTWPEPLGAHDLRHTCATEKGRLNWSEEKMRLYFGWAPGSDMPSHYIHLTTADLRDQVLRDAAIDATGHPQRVDVAASKPQLMDLLSQIMAKLSEN